MSDTEAKAMKAALDMTHAALERKAEPSKPAGRDYDAEYHINRILSALTGWMEAHKELEERRGEYKGYSPGYALAHWYEREQEAQNEARVALSEYVAAEVARQLEGQCQKK